MDLQAALEELEEVKFNETNIEVIDVKYFAKVFEKLENSLTNARDEDHNIPPIRWYLPSGEERGHRNPIALCRSTMRELCKNEETSKRNENRKIESKKNSEKTAREGLKPIPIPELKWMGKDNNTVIWFEVVKKKYIDIVHHAYESLPMFIDTIKTSLGDYGDELACVDNFEGITSFIGRRIIKGRPGLETILALEGMKNDPCLLLSLTEESVYLLEIQK